ncbi:MAG TPA: hypothetical protein DCQ49_15255, partial [Methylophaga sp.]|nr:hypothetical protein [Methylophaga sp.]
MSYAKYLPARPQGWRRGVWPMFCLLLLASILLSIILGPMTLPAKQSLLSIIDQFLGSELSQLNAFQTAIIWELR